MMGGGYVFPFEKLDVWQVAKRLVGSIYLVTRTFPADERYVMVSQINRAAISIASNLAEGSSRTSMKDQAHFTQIAYGSLMELACQVAIATDLGYVTMEKSEVVRCEISNLANKLNVLRASQLARIKN